MSLTIFPPDNLSDNNFGRVWGHTTGGGGQGGSGVTLVSGGLGWGSGVTLVVTLVEVWGHTSGGLGSH
jgi:hypothetical protein